MKSSASGEFSGDIGFQVYEKVSLGSDGFPPRISLALTELSILTVKQRCGEASPATQSGSLNEKNNPSATMGEPLGPLTNLLYRLNPKPSLDLIRRVVEADENREAGNKVAIIDPSLNDALRSGIVSLPQLYRSEEKAKQLFKPFSTFTRHTIDGGDSYGDDHKNLEGYDPDQEYEVYEYSSDPSLELVDPLCLSGVSAKDGEEKTQRFSHIHTYREDPANLHKYPPRLKVSDDQPFPDQKLAPFLLIHCFVKPPHTSSLPLKSFKTMLSHYRYMSLDEDHEGFSGFEISSLDSDYHRSCSLLLQEFAHDEAGMVDQEYLDLKMKEAKHWWYKNEWEKSSIAFYQLEGLPEHEPSIHSDVSDG